MDRAKTVKLLCIDGNADGKIRCELGNSSIIAYKIPKANLKECKDREEIKYSGVYILFGEKRGEPYSYIGESENVYNRLLDHVSKKDFWNECIVFVRMDNGFNKSNIIYLENHLYKKAKKIKRFKVDNGKNTTQTRLVEAEVSEMEEAAEIIEFLTDTLGYKIFKK